MILGLRRRRKQSLFFCFVISQKSNQKTLCYPEFPDDSLKPHLAKPKEHDDDFVKKTNISKVTNYQHKQLDFLCIITQSKHLALTP